MMGQLATVAASGVRSAQPIHTWLPSTYQRSVRDLSSPANKSESRSRTQFVDVAGAVADRYLPTRFAADGWKIAVFHG